MLAREKKIPVNSEGRREIGGETVTTDEDSGSEDDYYGDTEEERNEVDLEPKELERIR